MRAVRLYRESVSGVDPKPVIRRLAEQLNVHPEALQNCIRQAEADRGERGDRPTTEMIAENRGLVNEVLRAASAYFAAEIGQTLEVVMSFVDAHDFPVDRCGFPSRETRWPVGGDRLLTRHRQRAGGRFQFAAQISSGEFDGGRDAARAVEDRHRDRRFAALNSLRDVAICRRPDDRKSLAQHVGRGDGVPGERGQPGRDDTDG